MDALWLEKGRIELRRDVPAPAANGDEVLLDVMLAGICGTDMELLKGYAEFTGVPGHEFVGRVTRGPDAWVGRRVVASINIGCGSCARCQEAGPNHCSRRTVIGIRNRQGAFARQLAVPLSNIHEVPEAIDDTAAALVEPLAAALEITRQVEFTGRERVLVLGAGRLAQLITQVLVRIAGSVDVLMRNPERLPAFSPLDANVPETLLGNYDVVVEATGSRRALTTAIEQVRPGGTIVLKSTLDANSDIDLNPLVVNEVRLVGSRCGPFDEAIRWMAEGKVALAHLAIETFTLDDFESAFARAGQPDVYKVMFDLRA